jgi:hypothetical protein
MQTLIRELIGSKPFGKSASHFASDPSPAGIL